MENRENGTPAKFPAKDYPLAFNKALVIKPQWCRLILDGSKTWEMRSAQTHFRGTFGIIESGSGLIVGLANLVDCLPALEASNYFSHFDKHRIPKMDGITHKWKYAWVLEGATRFETPIPYRHPRGAVIWVNLSKRSPRIK